MKTSALKKQAPKINKRKIEKMYFKLILNIFLVFRKNYYATALGHFLQ
tara:strand:+ start:608 stop:751 length:144 start_codon:yes stop_codon:yes gene_type:complete